MVLEMPEYFTHEELVHEFGRQIKSRIAKREEENYNSKGDETIRILEETEQKQHRTGGG